MGQQQIGSVVIGRNEGERLRVCLQSLLAAAPGPVVYVDSGSTDGSVELAHSLGVHVVALDMSVPFTAARARNAGFQRLHGLAPGLAWVQFVDGDCELHPAWLTAASSSLAMNARAAAVCGRLRERFPNSSLYNSLCDDEWQGPEGLIEACGGNAMYRVSAFARAGGFNESLIAGEEPELCLRLRRDGWQIMRLANEMALHDAAMFRFKQWWQRARRFGFASANAYDLHGRGPERFGLVPMRRALIWAILIPMLAVMGGAIFHPGLAVLWAGLYPLQWVRLGLRKPATTPWRWHKAGLAVLGRFAEVQGVFNFYLNRLRQRQMRLIEYK